MAIDACGSRSSSPRAKRLRVDLEARAVLLGALLSLASLNACAVTVEPLLPTPVFYTERGVGPLHHFPSAEQWTPRRVYYATTRARGKNDQEITYGNQPGDAETMGLALIGFGGRDMTWSDLSRAFTTSNRNGVVPLSIAGVIEAGHFLPEAPPA